MKGQQIRADQLKHNDVIDGVGIVSDVLEDTTHTPITYTVGIVGKTARTFKAHEKVWIITSASNGDGNAPAYSIIRVGRKGKRRNIYQCNHCRAIRIYGTDIIEHIEEDHPQVTV